VFEKNILSRFVFGEFQLLNKKSRWLSQKRKKEEEEIKTAEEKRRKRKIFGKIERKKS
jgi:hypothetical protein